ncbi:MAG: HD-GYP domain-containing protein [Bacillota bacterium]
MLIVPIGEAREGMKLAVPVSHPENPSQVLLRQGYALDKLVIARMRSIGISFIYVEYPALDSLDRHLAVQLSPERQAIYRDIKQSITQVQRQTHVRIPYDDYCKTTRDMVTILLTQGQNPIYLDQMSRQGGEVVAHAAAVAHLSLLLGLKLEAYLISQRTRLPANRAKDITNLGVAGMLHDLGISRLPEALQGFCETNPPKDSAELEEWENHARIGYDLIHNDVESTAAAAVYQHHQHFDGSGFPSLKLAGGSESAMDSQRIHVFARIILCANLFDRLASPPDSRIHRSNHQVLEIMQKRYAGWYDPEVFRVLQIIAPPFPPGCRVDLTDGTRAIVTDINAATPMQPIVRRLASDDWELVGDPIDLSLPDAPQIRPPSTAQPSEPAMA